MYLQAENTGDAPEVNAPNPDDLVRLEELATVAAEKSALESEKMNDKGIRNLVKTISECKETAQGTKIIPKVSQKS